MRIYHFFGLVMAFFLLAGCETDHYHTRYIDNQSSTDLTFFFFQSQGEELPDSLVLASGERKEITSFHKFGAQPEGLECALSIDSAIVSAANGKELDREITLETAWVTEIEGKRTVTQSCDFVVRDSDLK